MPWADRTGIDPAKRLMRELTIEQAELTMCITALAIASLGGEDWPVDTIREGYDDIRSAFKEETFTRADFDAHSRRYHNPWTGRTQP